jgi:hypothetical protein
MAIGTNVLVALWNEDDTLNIGAHAFQNGFRLLTLDDRVYRAAFPRLFIIDA